MTLVLELSILFLLDSNDIIGATVCCENTSFKIMSAWTLSKESLRKHTGHCGEKWRRWVVGSMPSIKGLGRTQERTLKRESEEAGGRERHGRGKKGKKTKDKEKEGTCSRRVLQW